MRSELIGSRLKLSPAYTEQKDNCNTCFCSHFSWPDPKALSLFLLYGQKKGYLYIKYCQICQAVLVDTPPLPLESIHLTQVGCINIFKDSALSGLGLPTISSTSSSKVIIVFSIVSINYPSVVDLILYLEIGNLLTLVELHIVRLLGQATNKFEYLYWWPCIVEAQAGGALIKRILSPLCFLFINWHFFFFFVMKASCWTWPRSLRSTIYVKASVN